ncbi:hypothetical protein ACL02S_17700 [Nocardia sp. 004]
MIYAGGGTRWWRFGIGGQAPNEKTIRHLPQRIDDEIDAVFSA